MPREGDVIDGRYLVDKVIGRGGMSCIVRARQLTMQRDVAIKLLHPHVAEDAATLTRFEREVHLAKSLAHPNIIQYYDYGTLDNGSMYLVMELLNGCDLHALIQQEGTLGLHRAIDITIQILDGLTEAHAKSVIHRDLKPRNIFMLELNRRGDYVKILDFGIAKSMRAGESELTKTGVVCGTPSYLAPELLITQQVSPGSDLYSVGLVFLEMLTGRRAFKADTMARTFFMQLRHPVPIPAGYRGTPLEKFLLHALAKHPDDRFLSAQEMIDELEVLRLQFPTDIRLDPGSIDSLVDSAASKAPGMSAIDNMGLEILRDPAWAITPTPMPVHLDPPVGDDEPTTLAEWSSQTKPSRAALAQSAAHGDSSADPQGFSAPQSPALIPAKPRRTAQPLRTEEMARVDRADVEDDTPRSRALLFGALALGLAAALGLTLSANFINNSTTSEVSTASSEPPSPATPASSKPGLAPKPDPDFAFINRLDEPAEPVIEPAPAGEKDSDSSAPQNAKPDPAPPESTPAPPTPADTATPQAPSAPAPAKAPKKSTKKTAPRTRPRPAPKKRAPTSVDDIMNNNTIFGD
ncbi:serine/threonine protein kinase [Bradymonas sediminis]|nr:serine/threonine protein kinase [Bradymonas sediminis]